MACGRLAATLLTASVFSLGSCGCAGLGDYNWTQPAEKVAAQEAELQESQSDKSALARGRGFEQSGEWDKAAEVYKLAVEENPDNWELIHRWGVVADKQKRYALAQERYTRAIQLNPRNAQMFNDLGFCFYLQGKLNKAESALLKAVRLEPSEARFRNNLGMVLGNQGRIEEAFAQFSKAGSEADAFYNVAFIYASNDNEDAAVECFKMALEADPTHEKAQNALASFSRADPGPDAITPSERLVRYDEQSDESQPTTSPSDRLSEIPANRQAGAATRRLQNQTRARSQQNLASQRNRSAREQAAATSVQ